MIVVTQPKAPVFIIGLVSMAPAAGAWVDTNGTPILDGDGQYIILNPPVQGMPNHAWLDTTMIPIEDMAGAKIILNPPG